MQDLHYSTPASSGRKAHGKHGGQEPLVLLGQPTRARVVLQVPLMQQHQSRSREDRAKHRQLYDLEFSHAWVLYPATASLLQKRSPQLELQVLEKFPAGPLRPQDWQAGLQVGLQAELPQPPLTDGVQTGRRSSRGAQCPHQA